VVECYESGDKNRLVSRKNKGFRDRWAVIYQFTWILFSRGSFLDSEHPSFGNLKDFGAPIRIRMLSCRLQFIEAAILPILIIELPPPYQAKFFDSTKIKTPQHAASLVDPSGFGKAGRPWLSHNPSRT
jgi:hypothetical protein